MRLADKVAVVTGASRGLGLEMARALARKGARLVIAARGELELDAVRRELAGSTEVAAVCGDVSEEAERVIQTGIDRFGAVDILINNASELGPSPLVPLEQLEWQTLERILRVNVTAPLHLIQLAMPHMKRRPEAVIVNITSDAGVNAYPHWGGYGASKAALEHASRILADELEGSNIRVYVVDPGDMNTKMHQDAEPGADLSHLPGPQESARAIVYLLENESTAFGRFEARLLAAKVR